MEFVVKRITLICVLNIPRPEHHQSAIEHRHSAISTA